MVVTAYLQTVLTWVVLVWVYIGIGCLLASFFGRKNSLQPTQWFQTFWVGFAAGLFLIQAAHLFVPANEWLLLGLVALALFGYVRSYVFLRRWRSKIDWVWVALAVIFTIWLANRALYMPALVDTGFYNAQAVLWAYEHPAVPGLVNVHWPLGYSISTHIYFGILNVGWWQGGSFHIANGLLYWVMSLYAIHCFLQVWRERNQPQPHHLFGAILAGVLMTGTISHAAIADYSTDAPIYLIILATVLLSIRFMRMQDQQEDRDFAFYGLTAMIVAALTMKVNTGVFGLVLGLVLLWQWRRERVGWSWRTVSWIALTAILGIVPWMARSVVHSGYPIYPVTVFGFDVPWAADPEETLGLIDIVLANGFLLNSDEDWHALWREGQWLGPYLYYQLQQWLFFTLPWLLVIGYGVMRIIRILRRSPATNSVSNLHWLVLPLIIGTIVWLVTGPVPRYGQHFLWGLSLTATILLVFMIPTIPWRIRSGGVLLLSLLFMVYSIRLIIILPDTYGWLSPGLEGGFYPIQTATTKLVEHEDGLQVYVPTQNNQCWMHPLPCKHDGERIRLALLEPNDIRSGFIVVEPSEAEG